MTQKDLNPCNEPGYIKDLNIDPTPEYCREEQISKGSGTIDKKYLVENQSSVSGQMTSWLEEATQKKTGNGESALCDPQQTGHIINDQSMSGPNRNTIYRYAKSLRGTSEAMKKMFSDIIVLDEDGKAHNIPIIWGTQERAVAYILQENMRKDESLEVDQIRLPILAISDTGHNYNQDRYIYHKAVNYLRDRNLGWKPKFTVNERRDRDTVFGVSAGIPLDVSYTLWAWTLYQEDMTQILTQIVTKFSPMAYIRVRGVPWEIGVKLNSISNNIDNEPGDKTRRVVKFQFEFTAETYVAQPLVRKKSVLETKIELTDAIETEEVTEVLAKLEQAVKELDE